MTIYTPPAFMTEVPYPQFASSVHPLDVTPYPCAHCTEWRLRDNTLIGVSTPGYLPPYAPQHYYVAPAYTNQEPIR